MRVWRAAPEEAPAVAGLLVAFVRPEARGSGLGRALTQAVIDRAAARGCRRVELDVNSENPAALALYRSLGFDTGTTGGQDIFLRRRL